MSNQRLSDRGIFPELLHLLPSLILVKRIDVSDPRWRLTDSLVVKDPPSLNYVSLHYLLLLFELFFFTPFRLIGIPGSFDSPLDNFVNDIIGCDFLLPFDLAHVICKPRYLTNLLLLVKRCDTSGHLSPQVFDER